MILPTIRVRRDGPRGYRLINLADFDPARHELLDPADIVRLPQEMAAAIRDPLDHDGDGRKGGGLGGLTVGRGPGGRWCVKRGKERVSDLFDTEAEAEAARAEMEG